MHRDAKKYENSNPASLELNLLQGNLELWPGVQLLIHTKTVCKHWMGTSFGNTK